MPRGGKKAPAAAAVGGPSWVSVKSDRELRDPTTMFQPDPHPQKVQAQRQTSARGGRHRLSICNLKLHDLV